MIVTILQVIAMKINVKRIRVEVKSGIPQASRGYKANICLQRD